MSDSIGLLSLLSADIATMKLLIIEDDIRLMNLLKRDLSEAGFIVDGAWDGEEGLRKARFESYDLLILDRTLPSMDGREILKILRKESQIPVLMLTARASLEERVEGLDAGADDYLTKPFEFEELVARIHALLRRSDNSDMGKLSCGPLVLDPVAKTVKMNQQAVDVTHREFLILRKLISRKGGVLSNDELAAYMSNSNDAVAPNTIEVHISRLRKKIGKSTIRTVWGMGYTIDSV